MITLEEQIEYMRRHLDYCLEYPVGKDGKISAAILATLESCREQKILCLLEDGTIVGSVITKLPTAGPWVEETKKTEIT